MGMIVAFMVVSRVVMAFVVMAFVVVRVIVRGLGGFGGGVFFDGIRRAQRFAFQAQRAKNLP
jgi:hypothetical protein